MRLVLTMASAALILASVAGAASRDGARTPSQTGAKHPVARSKSTLQGPRLTFVPAPKVDFKLRLASQTRTKVTFAWKPQRGIDGYRFVRNGVVVSRTLDRSTRTATFWKGSRYTVEGLRVIKGGRVKPVRRASAVANGPKSRQRFVFHSAPRIDFRLRLVSETAKSITFAWKRQPLADGFQFVRNGVVVSRTFDRTTTRATFWKGFHYAVELLRVSARKRVTRVTQAMAYTRSLGSKASPKQPSSGSGAGSPAQPGASSRAGSPPPPPASPPSSSDFPNASNTGVPPGTILRTCPTTITASGTYDACQFNGDVLIRANNVRITRSLINGHVDAGSGGSGQQIGLVISDSTIDCGCLSRSSSDTRAAIDESNFTLIRVDVFNAGHGVAAKSNVVIQDSYIHGLGGNTQAHKNGIFIGDGSNQRIIHNSVECNDGPERGCTAAIGIYDDFSDVFNVVIDNNLLNTNGAYCFYGSGGPSKPYVSHNITFTNNHFGRKFEQKCAVLGPVTYWDASKPGMVWSGNVWDDTGRPVLPDY
jgi:hypothetical protein